MISIIHATRRPKESLEAATHWLSNISGEVELEYILSKDVSDNGNYQDHIQLVSTITQNDNRSAVDAFNHGAELATGEVLICISDDMRCFAGWDKALINAMNGLHDFYLKVNDGLQPTLVTMPVFDRDYYNRLGYVWNPDYQHMFVDQEATAIAIMLGRYIKSDLLFKHVHYSTGGTGFDDVNIRNNSTWAQGESLFNERLKNNFGIVNPVCKYEEIVWH